VGVTVGAAVGGEDVRGNGVLVGAGSVLGTTGISVGAICVQDTRRKNKRRFSIRFIEMYFGVRQLAGDALESVNLPTNLQGLLFGAKV